MRMLLVKESGESLTNSAYSLTSKMLVPNPLQLRSTQMKLTVTLKMAAIYSDTISKAMHAIFKTGVVKASKASHTISVSHMATGQ